MDEHYMLLIQHSPQLPTNDSPKEWQTILASEGVQLLVDTHSSGLEGQALHLNSHPTPPLQLCMPVSVLPVLLSLHTSQDGNQPSLG